MNNFVVLHSICVFSSEKIYLTHEDNFQNKFTELVEIYDGEKMQRKFSVFRKTDIWGRIFISAWSPSFDEPKYTIFIPDVWPEETGQSKMSWWLTEFWVLRKIPNLYVTFRPKYRLVFSLNFILTYEMSLLLDKYLVTIE